MPDEAFSQVSALLRDGDVLLSQKKWAASNFGIPGFWKHATIYKNGYVIEAVGKGVQKVSLAKWLYTHDYVCVLRPKFCYPDECRAAANLAEVQVGKPYDFEFSPGIQSFYCSELVFWAYDEIMGNSSPFTLRKTLGVDTVSPQDFYEAKDKFQLVWEFKGEKI